MKTFKDIIKEATTEINELPRRSKAFVDKHVVQKTDYPVDVEDQFTAKKVKKDKTKLASFHDGEDASVYEETDLDEASYRDSGANNMYKASRKADREVDKMRAQQAKADAKKAVMKEKEDVKEASMSPTDMKQREDIVKGMKKNTQDFKDRYGSKWKSVMYATATKNAMKEESEQIDELSKKTLGSYIKKSSDRVASNSAEYRSVHSGEDSNRGTFADRLKYKKELSRDTNKRKSGMDTALNKLTKEDLDEAFKAGAMKLNDGSSVTLTNESSNSLNNLFNQLSSPNKTKMEQRLMSGSKGFNEILAFAKEV